MNTRYLWQRIVLALLVGPSVALAQYTSKPIDPAYYTEAPRKYVGLVDMGEFHCSGSVVKDTRIMLSGAHCVFREDRANPWDSSPNWFLQYASANYPAAGTGKATRGYWYYNSYADAVRENSMNSDSAFNLDFIVVYSYAPLAQEAAPYFPDGHAAILQLPWKQTVGYPSALYKTPSPYEYYMHENGPWTAQCEERGSSYILCDEVSAGGGNSGGPVFAWDAGNSLYGFAGVYVSGAERSTGDGDDLSGINAMTKDEWDLVDSAIKSADEELPDDDNLDDGTEPEDRQRLEVYGNGSLIWNKKRSASRDDMTDFGSVIGSRTITRNFTLTNSGTSLLRFSQTRPVFLSGKGSRHFKLRSRLRRELAPNESQSLKIAFSSRSRGLHRALVTLQSDDPQAPTYLFAIQGRRR
jgi:hypothetical protein